MDWKCLNCGYEFADKDRKPEDLMPLELCTGELSIDGFVHKVKESSVCGPVESSKQKDGA